MLDFASLATLAADARWDTLIGKPESNHMDCKSEPYDLTTDSGRFELSKDVSAFANAAGGFILVGIRTRKSTVQPVDVVEAIRPIPADRFNTTQYRDVIGEWVEPVPAGFRVEWHPMTGTPTEGIGVITVPPQAASAGPFVVTSVVLDNARRRDRLVAFAERRQDGVAPTTSKDLARWLRDGRSYRDLVDTHLAEIRAGIADLSRVQRSPHAPPPPVISDVEVSQRIDATLGVTGLVNRPHLALAAVPMTSGELRTLFESGPGSITEVLERPPTLRPNGWSMETLDRARIVEGRLRELRNGDRKVLRLYRDGALVFACAADSEFLGFGESAGHFQERPRLIALALIEVTYLFCELCARVVQDVAPRPARIRFHACLGRMAAPPLAMPVYLNALGDVSSLDRERDRHHAPDGGVTRYVDALADPFDAAGTAYDLIREIYLWFGIEPSNIPYTERRDGRTTISAEAIRAAK